MRHRFERIAEEIGRISPALAVTLTVALGAGGLAVAEINKPDSNGCDATLSSPASWVVCSVADVGRILNHSFSDAGQNIQPAIPTP